jgi:hypothetical protein
MSTDTESPLASLYYRSVSALPETSCVNAHLVSVSFRICGALSITAGVTARSNIRSVYREEQGLEIGKNSSNLR